LQRLGLHTVADIAHTPVDTLRRALGDNAGPALHELAWGRDSRSVVPTRRERSIGADETFSFDVDDPCTSIDSCSSSATARRPACAQQGWWGDDLDQGALLRLHHDHAFQDPA
jgi:nucleotidyltransferase/DNA polymerase involved in DNA repair